MSVAHSVRLMSSGSRLNDSLTVWVQTKFSHFYFFYKQHPYSPDSCLFIRHAVKYYLPW